MELNNKHVDILAALASKVNVPDEIVDMKTFERILGVTTSDLIPVDSSHEKDWRSSII